MTEPDSIIVDTTARIFRELADPATVNRASDESWKSDLWSALEENGLSLAWVPEDLGGAGATVAAGPDIQRPAGGGPVAEPVAEKQLARR
ncbi:MAG: hypothetical protein OXR84_03275, partial [Magnetovibrio sp.]|nr:hypothetical protein [Magnetovibrio sp.]